MSINLEWTSERVDKWTDGWFIIKESNQYILKFEK
jgi:hypothetical protein